MRVRVLAGVSVALGILSLSLGVWALSLSRELSALRASFAAAQQEHASELAALSEELRAKVQEGTLLKEALEREQQKAGTLKDDLDDAKDTVKTLTKQVSMDPELLVKYSKVYFLNENYAPPSLSTIPEEFGFESGRTYEVHEGMLPFLEDLLKDAKEEGLSLKVASGYRSFDAQASLKAGYKVRYGSGANAFSADQGYSEHQLGTTVDFTTPAIGGMFVGFDRTKEFEWLESRAWRYGFILSYPKNNGYYQYEPWHWRFVGKDLAERLHDDKKAFYELDQRVIDGYLGELFD
ncbi:MAG TPA: D-alanyl-D-alanine carboxypeptidase family protein [Candidatus Paceibacterota bacterium]